MKQSTIRNVLVLALAFWGLEPIGRSDVLLSTNGERFVGNVVEETAEVVVFDSELGGRLRIQRSRILEIQRTVPAELYQSSEVTNQPPNLSLPATNTVASSDLDWRPPGVGLGHSDGSSSSRVNG